MFPKRAPNIDTIKPPVEALKTGEECEMVGISRSASEVVDATAPKPTLKVSRGDLPLSDERRHVTLVSLVQCEPSQGDAASRAPGDDAMLANAWPERTAAALPVVGTRAADKFTSTGSG